MSVPFAQYRSQLNDYDGVRISNPSPLRTYPYYIGISLNILLSRSIPKHFGEVKRAQRPFLKDIVISKTTFLLRLLVATQEVTCRGEQMPLLEPH